MERSEIIAKLKEKLALFEQISQDGKTAMQKVDDLRVEITELIKALDKAESNG